MQLVVAMAALASASVLLPMMAFLLLILRWTPIVVVWLGSFFFFFSVASFPPVGPDDAGVLKNIDLNAIGNDIIPSTLESPARVIRWIYALISLVYLSFISCIFHLGKVQIENTL